MNVFAALGACLGLLGAGSALAQSVAMTGGMGSKALLVVNGGAPRALGAGDTHQGVKVISVAPDQVVVDVGGQRQTVRMGAAPVSVGAGGAKGGTRIVLSSSEGGHFVTAGTINGRQVRFLVDTGATAVSLSVEDARRIGLQFEQGERVITHTANGSIPAYLVTLKSVRVGDVEVPNVQGIVSQGATPYVLLGNSFLSRFSMKWDNEQLTLTKRF